MPSIRIPSALSTYVDNQKIIVLHGTSVGEMLDDLTSRYPAVRTHLYDGDQLRDFVNIYLNRADIRQLDGEQTAVADDDMLLLVPSIAGG